MALITKWFTREGDNPKVVKTKLRVQSLNLIFGLSAIVFVLAPMEYHWLLMRISLGLMFLNALIGAYAIRRIRATN